MGRLDGRVVAAGLVLLLGTALTAAVTSMDDIEDEPAAATSTSAGQVSPDVDEETLAAFDDFPLLAPRTVPDGFELTGTSVVKDLTADGCSRVELRLENPAAITAAQASRAEEPTYPPDLTITLSPARCQSDTEEGADDFKAGKHRGRIKRSAGDSDHPYMTVYLTIAETGLVIDSDLPEDEVTRLVADLAPLKLDTSEPAPDGGTR